MPTLDIQISQSLLDALRERCRTEERSASAFVSEVLARSLEEEQHTLFQVSTSAALVQGIYDKAVSTKVLLEYGDFGLGTFVNLDGEMAILDGVVYQTCSDGAVNQVQGDSGTPFAVVTRFIAGRDLCLAEVRSIADLAAACDELRETDNLFYAIRIDGVFTNLRTRAMRPTQDGLPLAKAAASQPEFMFSEIEGTLVGLWTPSFFSSIGISGYHFHFLSHDRTKGGHLLSCSGRELRVRLDQLDRLAISLPESEAFLRAQFTKDPSTELAFAEQLHSKEKA